MANCFYKILNNKISAKYREKFISELQLDLKNSANIEDDDLYSMVSNISKNDVRELDINTLLKYYMLNQIMEDAKRKEAQPQLLDTKNPNIKKDSGGMYYRIKDGDAQPDLNLHTVNNDGSYTIKEQRYSSSLIVVKTYNINNQITSIKVTDGAGNANPNKNVVAELLDLRREYKRKYKLSGYSGNSKDIVAVIRNIFSSPIETGYYIDYRCSCYKWQYSTSSFERMFNREAESPYLVDIEFRDNGTVIRQEYSGIVA